MKIITLDPPRLFNAAGIIISDCATIKLYSNEQITLTSDNNSEFDIVRKDWGYYATPSLNHRLPSKGLRPFLVVNSFLKYFVLLVEDGKDNLFQIYIKERMMRVICRLDDVDILGKISDLNMST